jgi:hypothetical protein
MGDYFEKNGGHDTMMEMNGIDWGFENRLLVFLPRVAQMFLTNKH